MSSMKEYSKDSYQLSCYKKTFQLNRRTETPEELIQAEKDSWDVFPIQHSPKRFRNNPPLSELVLMKIQDLKALNKVHQGKYLKLKFILPCYKLLGISGMCQDHTEKRVIQVLIVHYNLHGVYYDNVFSPGTTIYVKEPVVRASPYGLTVFIDRQSDILLENSQEVRKITSIPQVQEGKKISEQALKYMQKNEFIKAYSLYTRAIASTNKKEDKRKFVLDKALVCQKLGLYEEFQQNTGLALQLYPNSIQVINHRIRSFILKGEYEKTQSMLNDQRNRLGKKWTKNLQSLLLVERNFKENKIDWSEAFKSKTIGKYISKSISIEGEEERAIATATDEISEGEIVLVEKSLCVQEKQFVQQLQEVNENIISSKLEQKIRALYFLSPQFSSKINRILYPQEKDLKKIGLLNKEINQIMKKYVFQMHQFSQFFEAPLFPSGRRKLGIKGFFLGYENVQQKFYPQFKTKLGLFATLGRFNRACHGNIEILCIEDTIIAYAKMKIGRGEQLSIPITNNINFIERKQIFEKWDYQCSCCSYCLELRQRFFQRYQHRKTMSREVEMMTLVQKVALQSKQQDIWALEQIESCALPVIVALTISGKGLEAAAEKFRKIFPMSKEESLNIVRKYVPK